MRFIHQAFEENWIAPLGPNVDEFEKEIANYIGVKGGTAVSSGTAAIHLALILLGVGRGDTVFCSTLTFVASANPILYQGATPVFIDSEPESWNMSPEALRKALKKYAKMGKLPKAVIVVHLYGQPAKMDEIIEICQEYEVPIIEDAAESLGSTYKKKQTGSMGDFGVISFNGNKIITTSGGGMLVSNNVEALERAKFLATQAREPDIHYQHHEMGFNYRMSNVVAGIGRGQLAELEKRVREKRKIFKFYKNELAPIEGIDFMPEWPYTKSNRWLSVMLIDDKYTGVSRNDVIQYLEEENIETRPVWKPLHLQPLFKDCEYFPHPLTESVSEQLFQKGICLPSGTSMNVYDQLRVISSLKRILSG